MTLSTPPLPTMEPTTAGSGHPASAGDAMSVEEALRRWPANRPLTALVSGGHAMGRWSYLAEPSDVRVVRAGELLGRDPLALLRDIIGPRAARPSDAGLPRLRSGHVVALGYELGAAIEPAARGKVTARSGGRPPANGAATPLAETDPDRPMMVILRCPVVHARRHAPVGLDGFEDETSWYTNGRPSGPPRDLLPPGAGGDEADVRGVLRTDLAHRHAAYTSAVEAGLRKIAAGDVYQVNIAHDLRVGLAGCGEPRVAARRLLDAAGPLFGGLVEFDDRGARVAIASASPELFLEFGADSGIARTRPMKGTRRAHAASELDASAKDRAELAMIVDLMRNDLGRVARFGSVRVDRARDIEAHGGGTLSQATATISAELRGGLDAIDLLRATFPPGSVTGAPKVRAMQLIDELERRWADGPRGFYCGAIGFIDDSGDAAFNVAIRTAEIRALQGGAGVEGGGCEATYPVGAGIVADSEPESEWRETLTKAGVLASAFGIDLPPGEPKDAPGRER